MSKDLLKKLVDKIAEPFWQSVYDGHVGYLESLLKRYKEEADLGDGTFTPPYEWCRKDNRRTDAAHEMLRLVERKGEGYHSPRDPVTIKEDVGEAIKRQSNRHADEVLASFKAKLVRKLNGVLDGSGVEGEIRGDLGHNRIRLREKATGLTFTVFSQIVSVWPSWARPHHRYPTTFHDVSVDGALKGRKLSEEEIKKLAAELRGEKFVPTAEKKRKAVQNRREAQRKARMEKELEKARRALERALKRCDRAATDYDVHSAQYDYDDASKRLRRTLKRYDLPEDGEELLAREPNFSLDDPATAPERLKGIKQALRDGKKALTRWENGGYGGDEKFQEKMIKSVKENLATYETTKAKLEELVKKTKKAARKS